MAVFGEMGSGNQWGALYVTTLARAWLWVIGISVVLFAAALAVGAINSGPCCPGPCCNGFVCRDSCTEGIAFTMIAASVGLFAAGTAILGVVALAQAIYRQCGRR